MMTPEDLQTQIEMRKDDLTGCLRRLKRVSQTIAEYGAKGVKETEAAIADEPWSPSWIQTLESRIEEARELHNEIKKHCETILLLKRIAK